LGGVVIGSVKDLSAGYYNPGALALVGDARFSLSAKVLQLQVLDIGDRGPNGEDRRIWAVNPAPTFFAGMLTQDEKKPNQFGFIYLARQQFTARLDEQLVVDSDVLGNIPGVETFAGNVLFDENLNEYWGGLMWSRQIQDDIGVGATGFVAYRGQRLREEVVGQAFTTAGDVASAKLIRDYSYYNWRTLAKLGIAYHAEDFTLGCR
jgi:hypothetical protein